MAKEIAVGRSFRTAFFKRFRNEAYGEVRSVLDTVFPVQQIGHRDFSEIERPAFFIHGLPPDGHVNRYHSVTLTSAFDIAIEEFILAGLWWDTTLGTPAWVYKAGMVDGFTPTTSYNPMYQNLIYWAPGMVPRTDWAYSTILIGARTPTQLPFNPGWHFYLPYNREQGAIYPENAPGSTYLKFDPPIILPAGMFLTWQASDLQAGVEVNCRYREIG